MAFFDSAPVSGGGGGGGKEEELKLVTVGVAVAVGAFILMGVLKNRTNGGGVAGVTTGAPSVLPPSAAGAQSNTVYIPVTGPTDVVETAYSNSYNQNSPVTDTTGQSTSTVSNPITGSPPSTGPVTITPNPVVILPPHPIDPIITPPTPVQPWWYGLLHGGPGASPGQHTYYTSQGETTAAMASKFHLANGWTDIAYNPHNQGIENGTFLSQAYNAHGANVIPAGTEVWITTSTITG